MTDVADRIALQDVMLKYAEAVDEKDYAGYRALFTDDIHVLGMGPGEIHGIDAWFAWWKEAIDKYDATQHMLGPMLATVDGDTARTRSDVQALHYPKGDSETTITLWATYKTDMRRVGGEWKISRHELVVRGMKQQP